MCLLLFGGSHFLCLRSSLLNLRCGLDYLLRAGLLGGSLLGGCGLLGGSGLLGAGLLRGLGRSGLLGSLGLVNVVVKERKSRVSIE